MTAKGLTAVVAPMLVFVAVTGAGLGLQVRERGERQDNVALNRLVTAARVTLADAVNAESGVRGYAATGDTLFLQPYTAAVTRIGGDLAALELAARTGAEQAQVATITSTAEQDLAAMARLRTAVDTTSSPLTLIEVMSAGKTAMDRLRVEIGALTDARAALVTQKSASITRLEHLIERVQIIGLVLGVLAGIAGAVLFTSSISRRVRAAADNAVRLGSGQPLLPFTPSADELGRLATSLTVTASVLDDRLEDLRASRDVAVASTEIKNTFLSHTSHELRTPLNAILGFGQLLEGSQLSTEDREHAGHILSAGRHLLSLINGLIDTAQVEAGELRLSVEPIDLTTLIRDVSSMMDPLAHARAITIDVATIPDGLAVYGDVQRLRQVLVNLTSNAVKYNRHAGIITLSCRLPAALDVDIIVTDTGPGLSPGDIERIFRPFERLEAGQHGIEGTGIGLPLAQALTRAMHGSVRVISEPGRGSSFIVTLPRAPDTATQAAPRTDPDAYPDPSAEAAYHKPGRGPLSVLYIEDNAANVDLLTHYFRNQAGYQFASASTGQKGIELANTLLPDVVLLDLHLADLSGEEIFARLHAETATSRIPVIVLSADASPASIQRLLARGIAAYLTKPLNLTELGRTIDELASSHLTGPLPRR